MNLKVINHSDDVFSSIGEAKEGLAKRSPRIETLFGHEITLTGAGKLKLGQVEGDGLQISKSGLKAILKRLKIPFTFGTEILPTEDLVRDVNSLLTVSERRFSVVVRGDDNSVVGFTNDSFTHVPYGDLLDIIVPPQEAAIESVRVNDENMVVNIVKERDIEPKKGDISKVGNRVVTSNTGFGDLTISTMLFRLICSNGSVIGKEFGGAKFALRDRSARDILTDSMVYVNQASIDVALISAGLDYLVKTPISQMTLFNVDADNKYLIRKPAMEVLPGKVRSIIGNKETTEGMFKDVDIETPAYDVYNSITQAAQQYDLSRRVELEKVGGSILSVSMSDVRKAA